MSVPMRMVLNIFTIALSPFSSKNIIIEDKKSVSRPLILLGAALILIRAWLSHSLCVFTWER